MDATYSELLQVRVIRERRRGARCSLLHAGYAKALARHLGARRKVQCSAVRDPNGRGFPSIWFDGAPLVPADGVIVTPEDVRAALFGRGIPSSERLDASLFEAFANMLNEAS